MFLNKLLNLQKNEKIAILGLGVENSQFLEWLIKVVKIEPKHLILADKNPTSIEKISDKLKLNLNSKQIYTNHQYLDFLNLEEPPVWVFKAPGIWSLLPELQEFRNKHGDDKITSNLIFIFEKFKQQIVAITGTKGKSTTSNMIKHVLSKSGFEAKYCGNTTGISPYQFWQDIDQKVNPNLYLVIETSSFQLQDIGFSQISSKYGVITNLYIDHLDQHSTKKEYWKSKFNLVQFLPEDGRCFLTNQVFEALKEINIETEIILKSDFFDEVKIQNSNCFVVNNKLVEALKSLTIDLRGDHNFSNLSLASLLLAKITKQNLNQEFLNKLKNLLKDYKSLPHRQEIVRKIDFENLKINFVDDGYATEIDAVIASLTTFSQDPKSFLMPLIGGKFKGGEFEKIIPVIKQKIIDKKIFKLILFSEVGKKILEIFPDLKENPILYYHSSFKEVVATHLNSIQQINSQFESFYKNSLKNYDNIKGKPELNIFLSPGGSSFDEFKNAEDRSQFWSNWVKSIK